MTTEGASQVVSGTATDRAGNSAQTSVTVKLDKTPPFITASAAPPANGAGWNNTNVTVTYTCSDSLSGIASCPTQTVVSTEGQNQVVPGQAVDIAGNVAPVGITLSIDKTAPTFVALSTPDHISHLHPGQISATVNDNFTVSQVIISVNGLAVGTFTSAPYQVALPVPAGANPGDTLTVTAQATDQAGNVQTASRSVRVAADGVIVGQVLDDSTSFPLQNASVQTISATGAIDQTDDHGRYSLQASDAHLFLSIAGSPTASPTTTVEREVFVQEGVGTVPVDARLTPLAAPVVIGSTGGTLNSGAISISVPAASEADGTSFRLTALSGQGLPGLLPLGWSPLAAFDLRSSTATSGLSATVANLPNVPVHLAIYDFSLHAWTMLAENLQPVNGSITASIPAPGSYALVLPDTVSPPIALPEIGSALPALDLQPVPASTTTSGSLKPAVLPASGGTSTATLGVQSPTFVPSGTVIQANVSEKFSLKSGSVVSEEKRSEDIVLYNALAPANSSLGAQFPVSPSRKFSNGDLLTGKVHLDILAGREGVRGQPGGSDPLTLNDGISTLSVPGGATSEDTAISLQSIALEDFIPTNSSMNALQEVVVDFSGERLNTPAQLAISSTGLNPADTFLLVRVERVNGVPQIVVAALAQINGASLTSIPSPGLPGVMEGGEYVFYDFPSPIGFIGGTVSTSAGVLAGALVQTDSLPLSAISGAGGHYILAALTGTVGVKASFPGSSLAGSATAQVTAGQTVLADIMLAGTVTAATISPADGTLGVPVSTQITVTTTAPLDPASISQSNLVLMQGQTPVPLRNFVLSVSGTVLSFAPQANLNPATQYKIQVTGLRDVFQNPVIVPSSTFTTKSAQALNFDPNAITFSFPDANGSIHVSAPAGSLPPGTKVLIVDQTSGLVLSLTAGNDGSVSGDFLGTINDVLQVTVTDPLGASTTFTRSQFVAADGTTAVGSGGGTVTGPGGVELRIPQGALDKAASFKIEAFGPDLFVDRPDLPGGNFGAGLKISSPDQPVFKKEVKLAFPRPADAPAGSFFQAYRRLQGPNGQFAFENLDYALEEGTGATRKVVTASFPFSGYQNSFDAFVIGGTFGAPAVQAGLDSFVFMMWTFDQTRPGIPLGGAITGRVRYAIPPGGIEPDGTINRTGDTAFVGVSHVLVAVDVNSSTHALGSGVTTAMTQEDGTFTFSDPAYNGGTINVVAYAPTGTVTASAIEAVSLTDQTVNTFAGPLLKFYRNVAFADMVAPAPAPPAPAPQIKIGLFQEVTDPSDPTGVKTVLQPQTGIITAGTPLIIGFQSNGAISAPPGVTINGVSYTTMPATSAHNSTIEFELTDPFTPATAGIYQIAVTGLTAFAQPIRVSKSFLVVAAGGSNNSINVGVAPFIASVSPTAGSTGVPADTFVQVQFSEPVTNLPGNVSLVPDDGSTPPTLKLSGIDYQSGIPIGSLAAGDKVASLTIQPVSGLKFGMHYTLKVTTAITDLDNIADPTKPALHLVPPEGQNPPQPPFDFTTFGPQVLGGTSAFSSTRPVVLGERAYVAIPGSANSQVNTYDISDPSNPVQITSSTALVTGRASDIAGQETSGVAGGDNLLAVATGVGATEFGLPANLWLFDTSGDQLSRIGAVSVTSSTVNVGQILRVALAGDFAYTSTYPVGINVVDLQQAISEYNQVFTTNPAQFGQQITTDGEGFANDAVVNTIPVQDSNGKNVMLLGIQAGDFPVAGSDPQNPTLQRIVVATGSVPGAPSANPISFVAADPTAFGSSALLYRGSLQLNGFSLTAGVAVALGQLTDPIPDASGNLIQKQVAVVVGRGVAPDPNNPGQTISGGMLAVVDMTVPSAPAVLGMLALPAFPTDVVFHDTTALVGTGLNEVLLVSLVDPRNPVNAGAITSSIFGDRLAITKDGILLGSSFDGSRGGIQTADIDSLVPLLTADHTYALVNENSVTTDDTTFNYAIVGRLQDLKKATFQITDENGSTVFQVSLPPNTNKGQIIWTKGQPAPPTPTKLKLEIRNSDGSVSDPFFAAATPAGTPLVLPSPVFTDVQPNTAIAGSPDLQLTIAGRLLGTDSQVRIAIGPDSPVSLPVQYISDHALRTTIPTKYLVQAGTITITLRSAGQDSNPLLVKLLPQGLPPAPILKTVSPDSSDIAGEPITITLNGQNFVSGDSVVTVDEFPGTLLDATVISPQQIQFQLPLEYLLHAGQYSFRVASANNTDLVSAAMRFVVNDPAILVSPPATTSLVTDIYPPQPSLLVSGDTVEVLTIHGSGFQAGQQVLATTENAVQVPLQTTVTSSDQMSVKLTKDVWGARDLKATLNLTDSTGKERSTILFIRKKIPAVAVQAAAAGQNGPIFEKLESLQPSSFYSNQAHTFLLNPDGSPNGDTFKKMSRDFRLKYKIPVHLTSRTHRMLVSPLLALRQEPLLQLRPLTKTLSFLSNRFPIRQASSALAMIKSLQLRPALMTAKTSTPQSHQRPARPCSRQTMALVPIRQFWRRSAGH